MKYFNNVNNLEDLKTEYKKLCKKYHPDICKDENATEIMQDINKQYDEKIKELSNNNGFESIIKNIIDLEDLIIEVIGTFLWVSGETYKHKDTLKENALKWCKNKKMWYYTESKKHKSGTNKSIDDIKNKYGCTTVKGKNKKLIA